MANQSKKKKIGWIVAVAIAFVVIIATVVGLNASKSTVPQQQVKENAISLVKRDLTTSVSATGTLESAERKVVSADVANVKIEKILVEEGDDVVKGQRLLTFDETDLRDSLSDAQQNLSDTKTQNRSELASANRKLKEAQSTYTRQKKQYAASVASAKEEYTAAKKAVSSSATAAEKEKAKQTLAQAKKAYEQAKTEQESGNSQNKSSIQVAKDQVTSTKNSNSKSLREAQKQVDDAKEALEGCSATAPMSGTVTAVSVSAGDTYSGGDMFEISNCSEFQVSTTVDEYDVSKVEKGQKVVVLTDATGDEELQGTITYVAKTMGSSLQSNTGSAQGATEMTTSSSSSGSGYEVRIDMETKNDKLRVGMTAKCSIILQEASDVFAVPYDAIHKGSNRKDVVYVRREDGTQKEVEVTTGMESDYYVQISGDELTEGMQIVIPTDATSETEATEQPNPEDMGGFLGDENSRKARGNFERGSMSDEGRPQAPSGERGGAPGGAPSN